MSFKVVATNRKARHNYFLSDTYEAGISLRGSEIKSIRAGQISIKEAYVQIENQEAWLINAHIAPYKQASYLGHQPRRKRKLLLHRREIDRLWDAVRIKGATIVPTRVYLKNGRAKLKLLLDVVKSNSINAMKSPSAMPKGIWIATFEGAITKICVMKPWSNLPKSIEQTPSRPSTIGGINRLPMNEKRAIYSRVIPPELLDKYQINPDLIDDNGHDLFVLKCPPKSSSVEISLYHQVNFPDPVLYGHITDTINAQIHILFYVLNDPEAQRFDIDRLPDGKLTQLGVKHRNIQVETEAMNADLLPGQIRKGPHMLRTALETFESFILSLHHDLHFAEPLYYHNAVIFERYGFAYQRGRRLMQHIQTGFGPGGELLSLLDGSTPFRQPLAAHSIRLRSWAIHDGILGEPFRNVTMYKQVGKHAGLSTSTNCSW